MSLEIKINGTRANIRDKQTIAYNLANFDITDIGVRKFSYTNSFLIPAIGNETIFGFASDIASQSVVPYSQLSIDVIADGIQIITDGSAYIKNFADGNYNIQITDNKDVISVMKSTSLKTLFPSDVLIDNGTTVLLKDLLTSTTGFRQDIIMSDLHIIDAATNDYDWVPENDNMSVFVKSVFQQYETVNSVTFAGDLWTDTYFVKLRMLVYYCFIHYSAGNQYLSDIQIDKTRSFYDLFVAILQIFGATYKITGTTITFSKLDNISKTVYLDWSGKVNKINDKLFAPANIAQNNYFRYSTASNLEKTFNQSVIPCNNLNLPYEKELIKFDSKVFPLINLTDYAAWTDQYAVYIKDNSGFYDKNNEFERDLQDMVFVIDSDKVFFDGIDVSWTDDRSTLIVYTTLAGDNIPLTTFFNSQNEYNLLFDMLYNPVVYEVEMMLGILDIAFFDNMKLVFIKELGGLFYVNTIKDYLLNSVDKTATVELIKINSYVAP